MAYKNGIEAKKDSTQRSEIKTHSPREVLSLNPTRTNRNATANSAALTWNVILTIDSTKTEIERKIKMAIKGKSSPNSCGTRIFDEIKYVNEVVLVTHMSILIILRTILRHFRQRIEVLSIPIPYMKTTDEKKT